MTSDTLHTFAIDPGVSGGMACLSSGGHVRLWNMPATEELLWRWASSELAPGPHTLVVIERVGGYVGGVGQPGSTMFNFGWGYGGLRMAVLAATGRLPVEVRPQEWQAGLGVTPRRSVKEGRKKVYTETQGQFKARLRELARSMFPHVPKLTLGLCDALLLAEYARRKATRGTMPLVK